MVRRGGARKGEHPREEQAGHGLGSFLQPLRKGQERTNLGLDLRHGKEKALAGALGRRLSSPVPSGSTSRRSAIHHLWLKALTFSSAFELGQGEAQSIEGPRL